MRALIILCVVAVASAGSLSGYNYGQGATTSIGGGGGVTKTAGLAGPVSYSAAPQASVHKEFYSFHANDDDFEDRDALRQALASVKKNVRVIFIKSPENRGYENAVLALAKQAAQQQTAIYVLHKQTDINELAQKFNAVRQNANKKPEVHFVKYRTPEDAANAQRAIQSQYDQLGGTSQSINGGVANAINFASQGSVPVRTAPQQVPQSNYLPASILSRLRH
ncbi:uncharacterized protein LOC128254956 [Drosophila gunungcola]|uniref:DUF243 domain-containing protein n=1 Tax=Drosophila gunungcola TaxID=103775 RepID=A0A9P9YZ91_9MUSC|nr:uncharacterized protein LOC128254956 [Drosophila gunungcola]KAI8045910.1 hypothetical protein M5D96_002099 [Drosophila gunungcola]